MTLKSGLDRGLLVQIKMSLRSLTIKYDLNTNLPSQKLMSKHEARGRSSAFSSGNNSPVPVCAAGLQRGQPGEPHADISIPQASRHTDITAAHELRAKVNMGP